MSEIEYLTPKAWAQVNGRCFQRAHQVLSQRPLPPGVLTIRLNQRRTYAIPVGTPWPKQRAIPSGFLSLQEWAEKVGKTANAAAFMFRRHGPPQGTQRIGKFYAVPEGAAWTYPPRGEWLRSRRKAEQQRAQMEAANHG